MTESTEAQIREHFPTMYMTIVSVAVALAFENFFALMKERGVAAVIGFAVIVVSFVWIQPAWRRGWQKAAGLSL